MKPMIPPSLSDLTHIPQLHETAEEHTQRMQWFRDAKFGMFIHWGPCTVGQKEIGWGRDGNRPWDINQHGPMTPDPEYDSYYTVFNPVKYDPDAWAAFAKESGMKYMVLVTKHHDGFSMFDTSLSDYSIMQSPYGRDIVGPFVQACKKHGLKVGLYYSTRDWFHPDYLVGDNQTYDTWYRGQVEELLTQYGKIDIMWYDHVGGRDWSKWKFDELFSMMYRHQPQLLVNNRSARFCGPESPGDQPPSSPELVEMTNGDYYTPEGKIGAMDLRQDWESCIHVGKGWSYRGEDGFKGPENCIRMLVSCVTGGGNLLLNFGPRPDGTFAEGEAKVAHAAGQWLNTYGDAVYGTRGGPFLNGTWGGSCHKGNKLYLHILHVGEGPLRFSSCPVQVGQARTLQGHPVTIEQSDDGLEVTVLPEHRDHPVTVVELTMSEPLQPGTLFNEGEDVGPNLAGYGEVLLSCDDLNVPSRSRGPLTDDESPQETEADAETIIFLNNPAQVMALVLEKGEQMETAVALKISGSFNGHSWDDLWEGDLQDVTSLIEVTHFHAGIQLPGRLLQFLKFEMVGEHPPPLLLKNVMVLGGN